MKKFQDRYSPMFRDATCGATHDAGHCPPAELLADLAAGRAWPWRRRRLVEHLSHCSHCADDYRVLTTARDGLVSALEDRCRDDEGVRPGWLSAGLASAAALVVVALSVSVLVTTDGPSRGPEQGVLFASQFEPVPRAVRSQSPSERVFTSDFGETEGSVQLFRDDFDG